ncbi:MAG: hypothetical protein IK121_06785, partial [Lachnospiraceae bacterium]|nr:hypothetical protein [Lachnospiraceae bacterium]
MVSLLYFNAVSTALSFNTGKESEGIGYGNIHIFFNGNLIDRVLRAVYHSLSSANIIKVLYRNI